MLSNQERINIWRPLQCVSRVLSVLHILFHLIFKKVLLNGVIIPMFQMLRLRCSKISHMTSVAQLVGRGCQDLNPEPLTKTMELMMC